MEVECLETLWRYIGTCLEGLRLAAMIEAVLRPEGPRSISYLPKGDGAVTVESRYSSGQRCR